MLRETVPPHDLVNSTRPPVCTGAPVEPRSRLKGNNSTKGPGWTDLPATNCYLDSCLLILQRVTTRLDIIVELMYLFWNLVTRVRSFLLRTGVFFQQEQTPLDSACSLPSLPYLK